MENNNHGRPQQNPEVCVSDTLKKAVKICYGNINFTTFIFFAILPLFIVMVLYEVIFQRTLVQASKILEPPYGYFYDTWPVPTYLQGRFSNDFCLKLVLLGFLHLLPLHLLQLVSMVVTVDLASKLYAEETPVSTLRDMIQKSIKEAKFKAPLITSIYVLYLSTCTLLGLTWLVSQYYFVSRNIYHGYFFVVAYAVAFVALLAKYLEWSAIWNLSIVISILEGVSGTLALAVTDHFSKQNKGGHGGLLLMLVFFLWGFGLRLLCLCFGFYRGVGGIILPVFLLCMGNVMKWMCCLVYFKDCKEQCLKSVEAEEVKEKVEIVIDSQKIVGAEEVEGKVEIVRDIDYAQKTNSTT